MTFSELTSTINKIVIDRFQVVKDSVSENALLELVPEGLKDKSLVRMQRKGSSNCKTLLIVLLKTEEDLKLCLRWSASVKDALLNPETSDLYLFIVWNDEINFSIDDCLRVEASEDFCRKYVVYPSEEREDFIARTFLNKIDQVEQNELGKDPLLEAFCKVEESNEWFNDKTQEKWKKAFKSGKNGTELIDELFKINSK